MSTPADQTSGITRRQAVLTVAAASLAIAANGVGGQGASRGATLPQGESRMRGKDFWPDGARLAVSFSGDRKNVGWRQSFSPVRTRGCPRVRWSLMRRH